MSLLCNRRRHLFCVEGDAPEFSGWISLLCSRRWFAIYHHFVMQFMQIFLIKHSSHLLRESDMITMLGNLAIQVNIVNNSIMKCKASLAQRSSISGQPVRFEVSYDSVNVNTSRASSEEIIQYGDYSPQHGNFKLHFHSHL